MRKPFSDAWKRRVMSTFGKASFASAWWRKELGSVRFCWKCGGSLLRRRVAAEHKRRLVCQACRHIHYENPKAVVAVLPVQKGKIWLLKRNIEPSKGLWTVPGGYVEMGETMEAAARRETREEIKTRIRIAGLQGVYSYKDAGVITVVYLARVLGPRPRTSGEAQAVRLFAPDEIPWRSLAFRSTFQALYRWVSSAGAGRPIIIDN